MLVETSVETLVETNGQKPPFQPRFYANKKRSHISVTPWFSVSGYQDSNLGPPAPKAGALTGLRYTPIAFITELQLQR